MNISALCLFLCLVCYSASGQPLEPFGLNPVVPEKKLTPADAAAVEKIDCLGVEQAAQWSLAGVPLRAGGKLFSMTRDDGREALKIFTGAFEPGQTILAFPVSIQGGENRIGPASYISLLCKSRFPAELALYLAENEGRPHKVSFAAAPGKWRRVILPLALFGLKRGAAIGSLGIGVESSRGNAEILLADIALGAAPYTGDSWKTHRFSISLNGDWKFAADPGNAGEQESWFADGFDDAAWKTLKSGAAWEDQGVAHSGYGWYRQKFFVPKEFAGAPLTLSLADMPFDDDVYVNGALIGGLHGAYKYKNLTPRQYTVPAKALRYGALNSIAIRVWGMNGVVFEPARSGLIVGNYSGELDPYLPLLRPANGKEAEEQDAGHFDLSAAQRGKPFELVFRFPGNIPGIAGGALSCMLTDFYGNRIMEGSARIEMDPRGMARAVLRVEGGAAQKIYFAGRFQARLAVTDAKDKALLAQALDFDHLSFASRDNQSLPPLAEEVFTETPYGRLKLVDEIDCALPVAEDTHPYLQSAFGDHDDAAKMSKTPGSPVKVTVREILGRKAREAESGWFAYRIGRGKLRPRHTYLLRIEYAEDKPRYCPVEIQVGHNFMDIGWKNGISADNPYDNWPLSRQWQWYDAIVPLDDETTGTAGTAGASAENGFWVYFMNKLKPFQYWPVYEGGPAISRMRLYEIDVEKNAPEIHFPKDLPKRIMSFDWERQADAEPADLVRYAKLMGYNAIGPIILKWHSANYGPPINGYDSTDVDAHGYWLRKLYKPGKPAEPVFPGNQTIHEKYLEATARYGIGYLPRFEYGGSMDLPLEARAIGADGEPAKPSRFHTWCANLLHPATERDLAAFMDGFIKPYVRDNPQLLGALWRIRCDRMPISFGRSDVELFAKETKTKLPSGSNKELAAWAASGEVGRHYADWWHGKRMEFHSKLVERMKSYRPDLMLYYFNWESDKFSLGYYDLNSWAFLGAMIKSAPGVSRQRYERVFQIQRDFTGADYVRMIRNGEIGLQGLQGRGEDYGLHTEWYKDMKGIALLAPANWLYLADSPEYLNYFKTADGLAVSNTVSYDEIDARKINPKYEGNMLTPAGPTFSMALELLAWFHGDAHMLTYTPYTYARGFAAAHRHFAQAFLALPAIPGNVVDQGDKDIKVRTYPSANGSYIGIAYKGYTGKKLAVKIPVKVGAKITNLVTNQPLASSFSGGELSFNVDSGPMELNTYLIQ